MSENLDLVRSICGEWERGKFDSADWADPNIEFALCDGPDPGSWKGLPAMARRGGELIRTLEDFRIEVVGYREVDDARILVRWQYAGSAKSSGVNPHRLIERAAHIFELRDGKVVRLAFYVEEKHALADLGLEE